MAVAALVLGILGIIIPVLGFPLAAVGLILGIIHLNRLKRPDQPTSGKGLAVAGIVCASIGLFFQIAIVAGVTLPAIGMVRELAREQQSKQNMKQLVTAMIGWEEQMDGKKGMPPSLEVLIKDQNIPEMILHSPGADRVPMPHYLYIRPLADPPSSQIVLVENPACRRNHHVLVCYGDSHVMVMKSGGPELWKKAQALAASPAAAKDGVPAEAWGDQSAQKGSDF